MVPAYLLLALVGTAIIWRGSAWLESASEELASFYHLPPIVQGAVVVAIGSSFPELATVVLAALLHGEFELGVSAVVGSALFNIMVIPALSTLLDGKQLDTNRDLIYKEAQFYMIAVAVLLLTFSFAVIYHPVDLDLDSPGGVLAGELTRPLATIPILMYLVYLFVQYQDTMDYAPEVAPEEVQPGRAWGKLLLSLGVILLGVEALVRAAIAFGDIFGTPSFLWGLTVVAAGTSVPDAFVSVRAARKGNSEASLANVLGSNVFDLLVAIPAGILIAGATVVNYSVAAPLFAMLTVATLVLFTMLRTRMRLSRRESWGLLAGYAGFVTWASLETFAVIDWVPSVPP